MSSFKVAPLQVSGHSAFGGLMLRGRHTAVITLAEEREE